MSSSVSVSDLILEQAAEAVVFVNRQGVIE